jgi:hypothetical protein
MLEVMTWDPGLLTVSGTGSPGEPNFITPGSTQGIFFPIRRNSTSSPSAPIETQLGIPTRAGLATSDTFAWSDVNQVVMWTSSSTVSLSPPSILHNPGFSTILINWSSGNVTVSASGSPSWTISYNNGTPASTAVLPAGAYATLIVDPSASNQWDLFGPPNVTPGVTSITAGTGLSASPNPIISTGTLSLQAAQRVRACVIDNDSQSSTALVAANFSGRCGIAAASTIIEIDVVGGTGVNTGTAAALTITGTSAVQLGVYRPSGSSPTDAVISAPLATASGQACALPTAGSATCPIMGITQAGSSLSISTTSLNAGDLLDLSAVSPDSTQTWYTVTIFYTVN